MYLYCKCSVVCCICICIVLYCIVVCCVVVCCLSLLWYGIDVACCVCVCCVAFMCVMRGVAWFVLGAGLGLGLGACMVLVWFGMVWLFSVV